MYCTVQYYWCCSCGSEISGQAAAQVIYACAGNVNPRAYAIHIFKYSMLVIPSSFVDTTTWDMFALLSPPLCLSATGWIRTTTVQCAVSLPAISIVMPENFHDRGPSFDRWPLRPTMRNDGIYLLQGSLKPILCLDASPSLFVRLESLMIGSPPVVVFGSLNTRKKIVSEAEGMLPTYWLMSAF